jgi:NAD dependent epimerase/dehydratase family enzyme
MPAGLLRLVAGDMADDLLLASQRVLPRRLLDSGFKFSYPNLPAALKNLLSS